MTDDLQPALRCRCVYDESNPTVLDAKRIYWHRCPLQASQEDGLCDWCRGPLVNGALLVGTPPDSCHAMGEWTPPCWEPGADRILLPVELIGEPCFDHYAEEGVPF